MLTADHSSRLDLRHVKMASDHGMDPPPQKVIANLLKLKHQTVAQRDVFDRLLIDLIQFLLSSGRCPPTKLLSF